MRAREGRPYLEASDLVVGENTCDGKKKAYEVLKNLGVHRADQRLSPGLVGSWSKG